MSSGEFIESNIQGRESSEFEGWNSQSWIFSTLNIWLYKFPRAQFWSDFQIFGTKILGKALPIPKNIYEN